jgi:hypothetical protein
MTAQKKAGQENQSGSRWSRISRQINLSAEVVRRNREPLK